MFGRYNIFSVIVLSLLFVTPVYWIIISGGMITIEKPYYGDYQICEKELNECTISKTPSCSPCESTKDRGYYFFYVLGLLVYLGALVFAIWSTKKLNKENEDLEKREKEVTKDEANLYKKLHPTRKTRK